jgi:uncharacterized protein with gpF-like domain
MPRALVSPTGKQVTLKPVRPNAAVEAKYRKRLERMVAKMQRSLVYWIRAQWRSKVPATTILAHDDDTGGSASMQLREEIASLSVRWQAQFDAAAPELAKWFATSMAERSDAQLRAILRRGGFSVKFQMSRAANDALQATIGEQVGLIKSIASQHLTQVQGIVMRGVTSGRDLAQVTSDLKNQFGVTHRRAAFIARDQANKASATINRVRQQELGITQAIWVHSGGGRHPRPDHVKASQDKLRYDVSKGALISGEYIYPGQLPNCRCVSRSILPGME